MNHLLATYFNEALSRDTQLDNLHTWVVVQNRLGYAGIWSAVPREGLGARASVRLVLDMPPH